jgi:uncharacterized protein (DUF302 family)
MDDPTHPDGLTTLASRHDFETTLDRLTGALAARGANVFAVIDHAAGAEGAGLAMPPTTVVIFGDPRAGTPLMQARGSVGIDLPLKILVWVDTAGATQVSYNDPAWIARRHGLNPDTLPNVALMAGAVANFASAAAEA